MGLRSFLPQVSACPGCGRTTSTFFQEMAQQIQTYLKDRMPVWKETHPGVEEMRVAVMGCVVNGPGESKHADIGISLPGTFEEPVAPVFVDGKLDRTLRGEGLVDEFIGSSRTTWSGATPRPRRRRRPGARAAPEAPRRATAPSSVSRRTDASEPSVEPSSRRLVRQPDRRPTRVRSEPIGAVSRRLVRQRTRSGRALTRTIPV